MHYCIVDAIKVRNQSLTEVIFGLGLYSLPYLCRRVDTRVKWHRGAVGRQLWFEKGTPDTTFEVTKDRRRKLEEDIEMSLTLKTTKNTAMQQSPEAIYLELCKE